MDKRIFIILVVLGVFCIGAVCAADSAKVENITMENITFNVPEGFTENDTLNMDDEPQSNGGVEFVVDSRTFQTDDDAISFLVAIYDGYNVTDEVVSAAGGEKTTINDVEGYLLENENDMYSFSYAKDGKLAVVSASDADLIKEAVVA